MQRCLTATLRKGIRPRPKGLFIAKANRQDAGRARTFGDRGVLHSILVMRTRSCSALKT